MWRGSRIMYIYMLWLYIYPIRVVSYNYGAWYDNTSVVMYKTDFELHSEYNRCECEGLWTIYSVWRIWAWFDYIQAILKLITEVEYESAELDIKGRWLYKGVTMCKWLQLVRQFYLGSDFSINCTYCSCWDPLRVDYVSLIYNIGPVKLNTRIEMCLIFKWS